MKDEIKEIKVSEEMERGGQCELDDNALEQAAGGALSPKSKDSQEFFDRANEWIQSRYGSSQ